MPNFKDFVSFFLSSLLGVMVFFFTWHILQMSDQMHFTIFVNQFLVLQIPKLCMAGSLWYISALGEEQFCFVKSASCFKKIIEWSFLFCSIHWIRVIGLTFSRPRFYSPNLVTLKRVKSKSLRKSCNTYSPPHRKRDGRFSLFIFGVVMQALSWRWGHSMKYI